MARKKDSFISLIFILFTFIFTSKCSKLNVPRVLLPIFNEISPNFTLEVSEGGCYKWTTSRLDVVQLIPLDIDTEHDCSVRVLVLAISKEHSRNTAIVLAEDIYTGQVLRCDVIVDVIASLNIVTTTRELFMEEAPEAFEVRAYDNQGNEFTTLEGVEFEWKLNSLSEDNVIRFITFRDSPYETPLSIAAFEDSGKQGHIILLEGVKTGSAQITVKLPHAEYRDLNEIEVSIMVIANLIIEPGDVYILRGDVINFKIIQVKHGRLEEIKLPESQYYLVAEDSNIGQIEKQSGYLTGVEVGKTRVVLHDNNVKDDTGLKLPSATVTVTFPDRILLTLLPYRNWATIIGEQHDIAVELFTNNDHKIHIGEGVQLNTIIDEAFFAPSFRATNGSFISGKTIQHGSGKIQTTLNSVISPVLGTVNLEPKLTAEAEILIHAEIEVVPDEVVLPWDPMVRPKYDINLRASGGDGKFLWSTSNSSVGIVTQNGLVRTQFHGQFDACASMLRNHHNRKCSRFYIVPPSKLEIVEFVMESEIGTPIFLNIALYGELPKTSGTSTQIPYTKCKELPFDVKTSDKNFYYDEKSEQAPVGIACTSLGIIGETVGTSRVTVSYKRDNINLEQQVTVSTFRPLKLLNPRSGESVLALGTSRYLVFTGGPRPWNDRPSDHIVKIVSSDPTVLEVFDETSSYSNPKLSDTYVIKSICQDIGEATVTLKIFNKPVIPKCKHKESIATAKIICAVPEFISLQPEIVTPELCSCPVALSAERVTVQNYRDTDLIVKVKDSLGRKFDNISSINFEWNVNPGDLAELANQDGTFEKVQTIDGIIFPNKTYQTIIPARICGQVVIEATITGYKPEMLRSVAILDKVSSSVTLTLVDDAMILPNRTSVYNHPLNKKNLAVRQGSGYSEISLTNNDIIEVKYNEGLREIEIIPKRPGEVNVRVTDLCLKSPPVTVTVTVVSVSAVRVQMPDRVEIGKCIPAIVKFYDEFDNLMPLPNLEYLDARFAIADKIINIKMVEQTDNWGLGEIHYILTGLQLGETNVVFSAGRGPKQISSVPLSVQVFAPLKINPKNATLIVGSILQFTSQGGPQPDNSIEFTMDNQKIADLSLHGILHATNIGTSKVTARAVSINPITGRKVTNSKDTVEVYIIPFIGIKLTAPVTRFVQGTTIPVWVSGVPEKLSALLIGSVQPPFNFVWTQSCNDIVFLSGVFYPYGVSDNPLNKISVRVKGIKPGTCSILLNLTVPGAATGSNDSEVLFTSSIDLEVIENLHLIGPPGFSGRSILMAPFSTLKLNTNKDNHNILKYSIHGEEQQNNTGDKKSVAISRHLISISDDGVITSLGIPGRAMVVITSTDDLGLKQTLSLIVQIKPVNYMLLTARANWMVPADENIRVVPLGSQFKLVTSYHDETGAKFSAAKCTVNFRTSRQDLVQIKQNCDNTSFTAYTMKPGSTVLKVWAENCFQTADYIQIFSGQVSTPQTDSLTSGDVLCMYCAVTDSAGHKGKWSAEGVINLNSSSGIGQAASQSSNKAYLQYDLTPEAKIGVDIEPIAEISFLYDKKPITNAPGKIFKIPILLKDAKHPNKKSNMYAGYQCGSHLTDEMINFPFECQIEFDACDCDCININEVFEVKPSFNKKTGLYSCDIYPARDVTAKSTVINSNVILKVISDNGIVSQPLIIPFLPAVFVSSRELLCDSSSTATLTVMGLAKVLKDVTIEAVDDKLIEVGKINHVSEHAISSQIKVIDFHWKLQELHDPMSVIVKSRLTEQNIKVQILLDGKGDASYCANKEMGSPLANFVYENKQTLTILLSTTILLSVTFYAYSNYMQPVINVNVAPGRLPCSIRSAHSGTQTGLGSHGATQECAALRAFRAQNLTGSGGQHECAALRALRMQGQQHQCAAIRAMHELEQSGAMRMQGQQHQCAAIRAMHELEQSERTMMLNSPNQTILNSSQMQPRNLTYSPNNTYSPFNRSMNTSGCPAMRYGPEGLQNRNDESPELRRNRRFL